MSFENVKYCPVLEPEMPSKMTLLVRALGIYWRGLFVIILPFVLMPVFLQNNIPAVRCLYVVLLMAGYWVTEALPLPVTSLIPMVLFPIMGILDSDKTSLCYLKETNMMFVGGLIIAIAVEHCNLHRRVALKVILAVGCSPRKLNFGLVAVTMLISMWISNTAAAAMMCPIIEATLKELESQGIGRTFEEEEILTAEGERVRKPSKTATCYFISIGYAASIGGLGTIVGSGTNLTFKGIYETTFPDSPGVEFVQWMLFCIPVMLVTQFIVWVWMQVLYMGLFRPKSEDAKSIRVGAQGALAAKKLIQQHYDDMGPISFHEIMVGLSFLLAVCLWFFRKPQFIPGWAELITDMKLKDASAALIVVLLMFVIPANPSFLKIFSKDPEKRPTVASQGLITWKVIQQKLPWGLIFLLGGGFALAEGAKHSGMSKFIADYLRALTTLPPTAVMIIACTFASFLTDFSSNVAIANVLLPVLAEMSKLARWHPMYLMMPVCLACSHSYSLPVSTPPNAIAAAPCNIPSKEFVRSGIGASVISLVVLVTLFPFLGTAVFQTDEFPSWAEDPVTNATRLANATMFGDATSLLVNATTAIVGV